MPAGESKGQHCLQHPPCLAEASQLEPNAIGRSRGDQHRDIPGLGGLRSYITARGFGWPAAPVRRLVRPRRLDHSGLGSAGLDRGRKVYRRASGRDGIGRARARASYSARAACGDLRSSCLPDRCLDASGRSVNCRFAALSSPAAEGLQFLFSYVVARGYFSSPAALDTFVRALKILTVAVVLVGVAEYMTGRWIAHEAAAAIFGTSPLGSVTRGGTIRATSTLDHPILFGVFCALVNPIILLSERTGRKLLLSLVCLLGCILSQSSAALMAYFWGWQPIRMTTLCGGFRVDGQSSGQFLPSRSAPS